jgi:hypothetical protein
VPKKESPNDRPEEVRDPTTQQAPPRRQGPQRSEGRLTDPADSGWGENWSEDVERTYEAPPPAGLNERQLRVYRKLTWHWGRAGSIPSQKLLAAELDIPLRTLKYDIAVLKDKGWLDIERRHRRGHRGGGRLKAGNRYFPKVSLNDLPEEVFPPRGNRTEGQTGKVPSAQVTPRGKPPSLPLGDGGRAEETERSDRGAKHVDNPPNAPTVRKEKPREERVSSQVEVDRSSAPGGRGSGRWRRRRHGWLFGLGCRRSWMTTSWGYC